MLAEPEGNTRLMKIPGCLPFNLTTNICRGFCMSYSIPATDDLAASFSDLSHDFSSYIDNVNMGTYIDKPTLVGEDEDYGESARPSSRNERSLDGADIEPNSIMYPASKHFEQDRPQEAPSDRDRAENELRPQLTPARDVISVSQCCNMVKSDDVSADLMPPSRVSLGSLLH